MPLDTFEGTPVAIEETNRELLPNLDESRRRRRFFLVANPAMWELVDGKEWLPTVKCQEIRPGLSGATESTDMPARVQAQAQGYIDLSNDPSLRRKHGTLMSRQAQRDGGAHYMPPWEKLTIRGGKTRKNVDQDKFNEFRRDVIAIVQPMAQETLEDVLKPKITRLASFRNSRDGGVTLQQRIKDLEAEIENARKVWMEQFGPKPKKGAA